MKLIATVLPALYFLLTIRPIRAIIALIMMCTIVGWIPASLWALSVSNEASANRRFKKLDRKLSEVAALNMR